ncbi:MAG TPA: ABC transporter permease [Thermoleophilia bacterium]|nr:ABC transporter permease [Thermoleophilia bacterium]
MTTLVYTRTELLRTFRSKRFFIMALGFPLALYFLIAVPNRNITDIAGTGISAPLYFMVSMAAYGAMVAALSTGVRIAGERAAGWSRQLRVTPLSSSSYIRGKAVTAYAVALVAIGLLFLSGTLLGVRLSADEWLRMTGLLLVGLIPFVALGVLLGHLLTTDSIGPAAGGLGAVMAFLGGAWFPLGDGTLAQIAQLLPSYWLVQASHAALGGPAWPAKGWIVVAAWSVALIVLARWAFRRDTRPV